VGARTYSFSATSIVYTLEPAMATQLSIFYLKLHLNYIDLLIWDFQDVLRYGEFLGCINLQLEGQLIDREATLDHEQLRKFIVLIFG
jgi:hypothetical protein